MGKSKVHRGLWPNMSAQDYHADPCPRPSLSFTLAKTLLAASPLHAWHASPRLNPDFEPTHKEAFDIGNAAHALLLGKGQPLVCIHADDYRGKEAREARDAAYAEGKTPLLIHQQHEVAAITNAARAQLLVHEIGNVFERPFHTECAAFAEIDGIWCRAMADLLVTPKNGPNVIYDYKTTVGSAEPNAATRTVVNMSYDLQAAHYLDVIQTATGEKFLFRFIVQEKSPPYALSVLELSDDWLKAGRRKASRAREIWRLCLDRGEWPAYAGKVYEVEAPIYASRAWTEREDTEQAIRSQLGRDAIEFGMLMQAPT